MSPTESQQLVEFLGQQFTEVDRRFTQIDQRFSQIDDRFTGLDTRLTEIRHEILGHFDVVYRRLERLEQEYPAITQTLRRIEAGLADDRGRRESLERDLAELKRHVAVLQSRIEEIEHRLGASRPRGAGAKGDQAWRTRTTSSTPTATCWSRSTSGRSISIRPTASGPPG